MKALAGIIRRCYTWRNLAWQALAALLTYVLVTTGFDWYWFTHTRDPLLQSWTFPAAIIGGLVPILLPLTLLLIGKREKGGVAWRTGLALAYAVATGWLVSSFYKFFTGRIPPPFRAETYTDISRQFNFGLFRDGIFWGWPSSHTTIAFAMAVTLFVLCANRPAIRYGALLVALYIGLSVSTNIHWFSEFVAGAIIGSVIGAVVGRTFWYTASHE
jgi:membrane-associated phospholipid phosphatase